MSERSFLDGSLAQLTMVRYREFFREPEAVFWVFIFPVLLAAGLGLAFRHRPPDVLKVGVVARGAAGDSVRTAIARDRALAPELLSDSAAALALRTGRVALLVVPLSGGAVEYRFDQTRPEGRTARLVVDDAVQRAAGRRDPVTVGERQVQEPGARYIDFLIPGLLGLNLMSSGIWGIGFGIVEARRKKLLKRLVATPMRRWEYLLSFLLSRLTLLVIEVIVLLGFGRFVFGVPLRGPLWVLAGVCLLSALAFSAIGLLISSRVKTMEAASGLMNLVMLPMWILSGVFFSAQNFPGAIQPVIRALPLTAAIDALRSNMLQGSGAQALGGEMIVLSVWLVAGFFLALRLFRWR